MKTIALGLMLILQTTGLWHHVPAEHRSRIVSHAEAVAPVLAPRPTPQPGVNTPLPVATANTPLNLSAKAAIAVDRQTATVLYSNNPSDHLAMASITKLATALVVLSRHTEAESITIPTLPDYPVEAETMGLTPGDTFQIRDLIEAALVPSANDAADALAISDAGSVDKFAARMNAKMKEWGIPDTHFSNSSGLQDTGNYTSAQSLAKIAGLALTNPAISRIVNFQTVALKSGQGRTYNLSTTNQLLASGDFYGIKTGYTLAAGECFVGLTRINGHEVITVVLGSNNRFGDTSTLTNWIKRNWQWL
jgi:D-alanyl-D-alanine carboxypeptidase (penicillin-binding protein 5/6)